MSDRERVEAVLAEAAEWGVTRSHLNVFMGLEASPDARQQTLVAVAQADAAEVARLASLAHALAATLPDPPAAVRDAARDVVMDYGQCCPNLKTCACSMARLAREVRDAQPHDGDEKCRRCGGDNPPWSAPSPLWNRVMRGDDIATADRGYAGIICTRCFITLAWEVGVVARPKAWRLYADPEPEGLVKVTPSGRVWDAERWLWVEPDDLTPDRAEAWDIAFTEGAAAMLDRLCHYLTVAARQRVMARVPPVGNPWREADR